MPLESDNSLPVIPMRCGTSDTDKVTFFTHAYSCENMSVGNIALHKWIITTKPEIFHNYIQFDDKHPFDPIILNCALVRESNVPFSDNLSGKLTAIFTYKTN